MSTQSSADLAAVPDALRISTLREIIGVSTHTCRTSWPSTAELGSTLLPPLSPTPRGSCYPQLLVLLFQIASISHTSAIFAIIGRCSTSGSTINRCCIYATALISPRVVTVSKSLGQLQILISAIIDTIFPFPLTYIVSSSCVHLRR
jgi:hypothetical protein